MTRFGDSGSRTCSEDSDGPRSQLVRDQRELHGGDYSQRVDIPAVLSWIDGFLS